MKTIWIHIGFAAILALLAIPCRAAVSFVQAARQIGHGIRSESVSFASNTALGNLIVVGAVFTPGVSVSSVADSQGNIYSPAGNPTFGSANSGAVVTYFARNIRGGADTITVTLSGSAVFFDIYIHEYAGLDTVNPLDISAGAAGNGNAASSGTAITTNAGELIFGICSDGGASPSAGSGFALRNLADYILTEDLVSGVPGPYAATAGIGGAYDWACQVAAFRPASSGTASGGPSSTTTVNVTLSGLFTWDTGAAIQGSVSLFQQVLGSPDQKLGQWTIGSTGSIAASLTLQVWGFYRFELRDAAGRLLQSGVVVAFPTLQSGQLQVVLSQANNQVKSAKFVVWMGSLITAKP